MWSAGDLSLRLKGAVMRLATEGDDGCRHHRRSHAHYVGGIRDGGG